MMKLLKFTAVPLLLISLFLLSGCFGDIERPVADFDWCPDGSLGELDYLFISVSAPSGSPIVSETWEFGDGSAPVETEWGEVWHRFPSEGIYHVTLTVTDRCGISGTVTKEVDVRLAAYVHPDWRLTLGFPVKVSGIVENRSAFRLIYVAIKAKFYDPDGIRLTDGTVEITDLEPGEKAAFEVRAEESSTRIFYATVKVDSFIVDCPFSVWGPGLDEADR